MKVGIEVEGRLKGVPTLFCGAHEYLKGIQKAKEQGVSHLYISDNRNKIAYDNAALAASGLLVTLDVTEVYDCPNRADNITLMLRLPGHCEVRRLKDRDQVKFEAKRNVVVLPMHNAIKTLPHEFLGDRKV